MSSQIPLKERQRRYAELIVRFGVNLQPGQGLVLSFEPVAREFANLLVVEAYQAGAKYVHLDCDDPLAKHARLAHIRPEHLEYIPDYEVARRDQYVDEAWARIAITTQEFPQLFDDIDAGLMARSQSARAAKLKRYTEAMMSTQFQWCVIAVPTKSWARQVFPDLSPAEGVKRLWDLVLRTVRADQPNPAAAWAAHDALLKRVSAYLASQRVTGVHFFDPAPADDGAPCTDLRIGLTDSSVWVAASSTPPNGVSFMANMPTEEVFTSPHRMKTEGYVRTSKPIFPLGREVREA